MRRLHRLAAAGLGLVLLSGCGSSAQTRTADVCTGSTVTSASVAEGSALSGHTLSGVLTVMMSDDIAKGAPCQPPGAYDDITVGAPVVVMSGSGDELGRGSLEAGLASSETFGPTTSNCEFAFRVDGLPDAESYTVVISHVKDQTLSAAELEAGDWTVAFGLAMPIGG